MKTRYGLSRVRSPRSSRALLDLLFVLDDDPLLLFNHVLSRGPGWKRDRAQPLAGGGLRDGDRNLNDPGRLHYRPAGAARADSRQAEDTEGSRSGFH